MITVSTESVLGCLALVGALIALLLSLRYVFARLPIKTSFEQTVPMQETPAESSSHT